MGHRFKWIATGTLALLIIWGILYTAAFFGLRGDIKALEAAAAADRLLLEDTRSQLQAARQERENLLAYVITMREKLAATGFHVPPIEGATDEDQAERSREEDPVRQ